MYNCGKTSSSELWAIVNSKGEILWSLGGSSTNPKLMVYSREKEARARLTGLTKRQRNDYWSDASVKLVYSVGSDE